MKTIFTRYIPATNYKGSRIKAYLAADTAASGKAPTSKTYGYPHDSNDEHLTIASRFAEHLGWLGNGATVEQISSTPDGKGYIFTVKQPAQPKRESYQFAQCDGNEWTEQDHRNAQKMARKLGYWDKSGGMVWAWTTSSDLHGYFCQAFNPEHNPGKPTRKGTIIKTPWGLLFVQDFEDITGFVEQDADKV
jgi:hypothetical protein